MIETEMEKIETQMEKMAQHLERIEHRLILLTKAFRLVIGAGLWGIRGWNASATLERAASILAIPTTDTHDGDGQ